MTMEANETCPKCGSDNAVVIKPKADGTESGKHDRQCHDCKVSWTAATGSEVSESVPRFDHAPAEALNGAMKYLHTMVRVTDLNASLEFYCTTLGLRELRRKESEQGRFTLVFLAAPNDDSAQIELTYNWDPEVYTGGRNFGHLAYEVDDIYALCERLLKAGVTIERPPRDGRMAFIRSPDNISIELLQAGEALPPAEPWTSMPNTGAW